MQYVVCIEYQEPTYDQHVGRKRGPFMTLYHVRARSDDEAMRIGRQRFEREATESSVRWAREIVSCRAYEDPGPPPPTAGS